MKQPSRFAHLRDIFLLPFTVTVVLPWLIYDAGQQWIPDTWIMKSVGILLMIPGVLLLGYTIFLFGRYGKGTLAPWNPTQKLIVTGPYRYCRNPMISGVFFILCGEVLLFHSTSILILAASFFLVNTVYFILSEEPGLEKRFGEEYRRYKREVPRWFPRFRPFVSG